MFKPNWSNFTEGGCFFKLYWMGDGDIKDSFQARDVPVSYSWQIHFWHIPISYRLSVISNHLTLARLHHSHMTEGKTADQNIPGIWEVPFWLLIGDPCMFMNRYNSSFQFWPIALVSHPLNWECHLLEFLISNWVYLCCVAVNIAFAYCNCIYDECSWQKFVELFIKWQFLFAYGVTPMIIQVVLCCSGDRPRYRITSLVLFILKIPSECLTSLLLSMATLRSSTVLLLPQTRPSSSRFSLEYILEHLLCL